MTESFTTMPTWNEKHLRAATRAAGIALWSWNVDSDAITMDERAYDLWQVSKALVSAPESWSPERAKIKRPGEWYVAMRRAAGLPAGDGRLLVQGTSRLGEPLWRPPAPRGFSDDNGAWLDGLAHRLDAANAFAQNANARIEPAAVLETALGPLASATTRQAVARAESKAQALTFVLMAPEFQRR